jgi:hypothetical protein
MNAIIINAIENRNLLKFFYKNHLRIVEPHAYGKTIKGNELLRAYQIEGTSDSGKVPDWRLFSVNKIERITVLDDTFLNPRVGYKSGDSALDDIYCEL